MESCFSSSLPIFINRVHAATFLLGSALASLQILISVVAAFEVVMAAASNAAALNFEHHRLLICMADRDELVDATGPERELEVEFLLCLGRTVVSWCWRNIMRMTFPLASKGPCKDTRTNRRNAKVSAVGSKIIFYRIYKLRRLVPGRNQRIEERPFRTKTAVNCSPFLHSVGPFSEDVAIAKSRRNHFGPAIPQHARTMQKLSSVA